MYEPTLKYVGEWGVDFGKNIGVFSIDMLKVHMAECLIIMHEIIANYWIID